MAAATQSGHIAPSTIKSSINRALRLSGVRPFVVYTLRHTFLTRLGEAGCDVWTHPSNDAVMNVFSRMQLPKEVPARAE
jgi:integrase